MASPVLFSTGASPAAAATSRNLVEFKAGKMEMREKMVHPIRKQGLVFLKQSQDDNLMHFCWKDRQTGVVEDDLILFPDDCEFKRVKECTTGRVYVLKMKSSNKQMFFWMQESRADRDDEFCKKINETLNNPPRGGNEMGGSVGDRDLQNIFGNMTQEQVAQLLSTNGVNLSSLLNSAAGRSPSSNSGASASSTASTNNSTAPTSAANVTTPNLGARDAEAFRSFLSEAGPLDETSEDADMLMDAALASSREAAAGGASQSRESQPLIDLATAINSESLAHLLEDEEFLKQIEPHLPPVSAIQTNMSSEERKKQFSDTVRSSQFRSSLSQFCIALQSGQLGPLMSQFGLNQACVDAANLGNLEAFVRALDAQTASGASQLSSGQPSESSDKKDKTG